MSLKTVLVAQSNEVIFFPVVVTNTCFWTTLKIKSEMPIFVRELHVVSSFFALPH